MKKSKAFSAGETLNNLGPIKVYYDGLCRVCSFEINHYKTKKGSDRIQFIDITRPDFDAKAEGVDPYLVHRYLHAKTSDGRLVSGVETFRLIWSRLPDYQWAYRASTNRLISAGLEAFYFVFVRVRPYLPRHREACADSPYCDLH